ncbi:MAG TPA: PTS sugar transporter subunit IIA [Planctomicrobium sp.]|nr:PTS sugar transporter subunit IIA [Planctomicrobium sp.]
MRLTEFVVPEAILPQLQADSKESAIRQLVASLKNAGKIQSDDEEAIVSAILKREELGSTGIGRGVAVPHTKHPSAQSMFATIAICHDGLDFESLDGEDVFILFLLVSPPDRPGDHLRGLETITRHLKNDDFCKFLRQATTVEAVVDLLQEADEGQS